MLTIGEWRSVNTVCCATDCLTTVWLEPCPDTVVRMFHYLFFFFCWICFTYQTMFYCVDGPLHCLFVAISYYEQGYYNFPLKLSIAVLRMAL